MTHLNEEQLILAYYRELPSAEVDEHLAACEDCRAEMELLRRDLAALESFEVPQRDADYEQQQWNRLRWKLGRARATSRWIPLSAAASLLLVAVLATYWIARRQPIAPVPTAAAVVPVKSTQVPREDRVLLLVVSEHFDRSSRLLLEVSNVPTTGSQNLEPEQKSAEELIEANRLYRQTATRNGQHELATVLEELEPILLSVAHAPAHIQAAELRALQQRIESKGMVFKLRVLADESSETPSDRSSI